jgi:LruC domain-containing protein
MKTAKYVIVAMGLVLLLSSCFMSNPWLSGGEGDSVYLPPDVIKDTTRSGSEPFQFETLLPVTLDLQIDFYEVNSTGDGSNLEKIAPDAGRAVVVITNSKGNIVYEGAVQADGSLDAQLVLPADPEDMVLTVKGYGFKDRSVKISDLVNYSKIERKMGLMSEGLSAKELGSPESWDSDNDMVPDVYDAFPNDPDYAFVLRYPDDEEEYMTVAYEDLYLIDAAGDADYNDFLAKYAITEKSKLNKDGKTMLSSIEGDITAEVKIAGYDHLFGIAFGFTMEPEEVLDGKFTLTYFGSDGVQRQLDPDFDLADFLVPIPEPNDSPFTHKVVVPLFGSTAAATLGGRKPTAHFEVKFASDGIDRNKIQLAPYDPFIYVWNTHYDIHLIGETPLSGIPDLPGIKLITQLKSSSTSSPYTFMDGEGFPWSLLVPVQWQHPGETQRIEKVYPFFDGWRKSKGAGNTDWYLWYLSNMDPNNEPPDVPVLDPDSLEFDRTDRTPQEAKFDITLGTDPDSDKPVILDWTDPPTYIVLDENTVGPESHKMIVDFPDVSDEPGFTPPETLNIYFWCLDAEGAPSEFVPLELSFVEPAERMRIIIETFPSIEGSAATDTILTLYNKDGTELDSNTNNPNVPSTHQPSARLDYQNGLDPGVYYIRVSGIGAPGTGPYVIRALALAIGKTIPAYVYPGSASDDSAFEPDDATTGNIPDSPVDLGLGNANQKNRYLDSMGGDVDWLRLELLP